MSALKTKSSPPNIVAIVPMRHESQRVEGKNYRQFAGRPLYHYIIETLLDCGTVSEVAIDTDSDVILKDASSSFPSVRLLHRPKHLQAPEIPMNDVLLNAVEQLDADFYLQTHSTNPLLKSDTIGAAIAAYLETFPIYDSLFSVTRWQSRLYDHLSRPINHNPAILLRTQDLPPVYEENSCLYLFTKETLLHRHNRIGERPYLFEIDRREALDIDEEADFQLAELAYISSKSSSDRST